MMAKYVFKENGYHDYWLCTVFLKFLFLSFLRTDMGKLWRHCVKDIVTIVFRQPTKIYVVGLLRYKAWHTILVLFEKVSCFIDSNITKQVEKPTKAALTNNHQIVL